MYNSRENRTPMFSLPFSQNEFEDYYIKQAGMQHGSSMTDYYQNQARMGAGFYSGVQYQKGDGLGGLLARVGCFVLLILKPAAKAVGRQALKVMPLFAEDVFAVEPPGKALSKWFHQEASKLVRELTGEKQPKKKVKKN